MTVEAAKVKVRRAIRIRTTDEGERKRLYTLLKTNRVTDDSFLRRKLREHWKRGRNHTHNQIIVRSDTFYCFDGVVLQADENTARNVLARLFDPEIDRWTPYRKVKAILLARTERLRLGLLNQDSSCGPFGPSTESEMPHEQLCSSF